MRAYQIAAGAALALAMSSPVFAQSMGPYDVSYYGTLGYSNLSGTGDNSPDFNAVTERLGARFGKYFGVEGEVSEGLNSQRIDLGGTPADVRMNVQYAGYGVGYLPIMRNADLFARIGYGGTNFSSSGPDGRFSGEESSWNWGGGGQYFFTPVDGVRAEYTRYNYNFIPDANTWSVSYVRKF